MANYIKLTLLSLLLAITCWSVLLLFGPSGFDTVLTIGAFAFSIVFFCFLIICIMKALGRQYSPYRIFAVINGALAFCVTAYAIYDMLTDTGWFAGLLGVILLVYVVPIFLALLLLDFIIWKASRRHTKNRTSS